MDPLTGFSRHVSISYNVELCISYKTRSRAHCYMSAFEAIEKDPRRRSSFRPSHGALHRRRSSFRPSHGGLGSAGATLIRRPRVVGSTYRKGQADGDYSKMIHDNKKYPNTWFIFNDIADEHARVYQIIGGDYDDDKGQRHRCYRQVGDKVEGWRRRRRWPRTARATQVR